MMSIFSNHFIVNLKFIQLVHSENAFSFYRRVSVLLLGNMFVSDTN